ncbi:DNA polymerase III subunit gamma/tau [Arhodomonas sp. SL1]|uniref:DNA polymerase III subunit gamma/tau n=1 Tax=Arhodomonas sp. SL1 TaxID=3425691 RepID=UPI003F882C09
MAYQVLARKWRPRTFAEMAGQEHVLRALTNGIAQGRLHHAYLFTGTRGVGKTTIARIFAKCLNCEANGVTIEPCGSCEACREIDEGRFVDLIEVDAASRTGVDDTRELLDNIQYAPSRGRYKIYLIDEVHMFSRHSFNALLKTLEEPPPHVKFLLATTDPQKLPVTILSRCLQFNLKHLPAALIAEHLGHILEREGIEAESAAVQRLARAADGSMRDALSLLDQALGFGGGALTDADVRSMLGTLETDFVVGLLEAVADGDAAAVMRVIAEMSERAPDFGEGISEVLAVLHRIGVMQLAPGALTEGGAEDERLQALARRLGSEDVQLYYQIALHGRRDLPWAPDARTGFEMAMLRMLAFRPEEGGSGGVAPLPAQGATRAAGTVAVPAQGGAASGEDVDDPAPADGGVTDADAAAPSAPADTPPGDAVAEGPDWATLLGTLRIGGMARALAEHCRWGAREGERVRLYIDEGHQHLNNESGRRRIAEALSEHFGTTVRVDIQVGEGAGEAPADQARRQQRQREAEARERIAADPNVRAMQEAFDAELLPESIRPLD